MSTAALSSRLAELGQPIQDTGITKIEKGDRRVDVDDLIALALALDVTPNALLLPEVDLPAMATDFPLTPQGATGRPRQLWAWATGEEPLGHVPANVLTSPQDKRDEVAFVQQNRPHRLSPAGTAADRMEKPFVQDRVLAERLVEQNAEWISRIVADAFRGGATSADVRDVVETTITACLLLPPGELPRDFGEVRRLLDARTSSLPEGAAEGTDL